MKVLVVGAGFAGSVYARVGADAGHEVCVIDAKPHLGGSAHDRMIEGLRVNDYGPHLFNTSNMRVVSWLSQFTEWTPYTHAARALLPSGDTIPFPLNLDSLDALKAAGYDTAPSRPKVTITKDTTARDWLASIISDDLIDLFFARYVRKMWGISLDELPAKVVQRVHVRENRDSRSFPSAKFQALPRDGYAALFANMLKHPRISIKLNQPYDHGMRRDFDMVFCSMPIDLFYDQTHGELPYRSVRFHTFSQDVDPSQGCATLNMTDLSTFTRKTYWQHVTGTGAAPFVTTFEEPCSPEQNGGARYYPMRTIGGAEDALLAKYQKMAEAEAQSLKFIGRCGAFQYLNMDQVVGQSLQGATRHFGIAPKHASQSQAMPQAVLQERM
ncbi:MAG: UDP-galactopyranose mutase [Sulfitobacter sp.]